MTNEDFEGIIEALEAKLVKAVEALRKLHHAVCGETGFAACVRLDSGLAYPWPALDEADEMTRALLAEIDPEELARWREEAVQAEREACAKLRYFHPEGETMAQMRDHARNHPLYREGDLKLVWVNEGDLCNLAIRAMKGCTP